MHVSFLCVSRSSHSHLLFVAKRVAKMELGGKIVVGPHQRSRIGIVRQTGCFANISWRERTKSLFRDERMKRKEKKERSERNDTNEIKMLSSIRLHNRASETKLKNVGKYETNGRKWKIKFYKI